MTNPFLTEPILKDPVAPKLHEFSPIVTVYDQVRRALLEEYTSRDPGAAIPTIEDTTVYDPLPAPKAPPFLPSVSFYEQIMDLQPDDTAGPGILEQPDFKTGGKF